MFRRRFRPENRSSSVVQPNVPATSVFEFKVLESVMSDYLATSAELRDLLRHRGRNKPLFVVKICRTHVETCHKKRNTLVLTPPVKYTWDKISGVVTLNSENRALALTFLNPIIGSKEKYLSFYLIANERHFLKRRNTIAHSVANRIQASKEAFVKDREELLAALVQEDVTPPDENRQSNHNSSGNLGDDHNSADDHDEDNDDDDANINVNDDDNNDENNNGDSDDDDDANINVNDDDDNDENNNGDSDDDDDSGGGSDDDDDSGGGSDDGDNGYNGDDDGADNDNDDDVVLVLQEYAPENMSPDGTNCDEEQATLPQEVPPENVTADDSGKEEQVALPTSGKVSPNNDNSNNRNNLHSWNVAEEDDASYDDDDDDVSLDRFGVVCGSGDSSDDSFSENTAGRGSFQGRNRRLTTSFSLGNESAYSCCARMHSYRSNDDNSKRQAAIHQEVMSENEGDGKSRNNVYGCEKEDDCYDYDDNDDVSLDRFGVVCDSEDSSHHSFTENSARENPRGHHEGRDITHITTSFSSSENASAAYSSESAFSTRYQSLGSFEKLAGEGFIPRSKATESLLYSPEIWQICRANYECEVAAQELLSASDEDTEIDTNFLLFSEEMFRDDYEFLRYANMLVPLDSHEAASCSRTRTFGYVPVHDHESQVDTATSLILNNHQELREVSDEVEIYKSNSTSDFSPENDEFYEDYVERQWFDGSGKSAVIVAPSKNNGLQHLPTKPTKTFVDRLEKLFRAYLVPNRYQEVGVAVSNDAAKLAHYLSSDDPNLIKIVSYDDKAIHSYQYFVPSSMAALPN